MSASSGGWKFVGQLPSARGAFGFVTVANKIFITGYLIKTNFIKPGTCPKTSELLV